MKRSRDQPAAVFAEGNLHGEGDGAGRTFRWRHDLSGVLSAFYYHRWHAPVSGDDRESVPGRRHVSLGRGIGRRSPGGLNDSRGYISAVAARAVIVIDCDDPAISEVRCVFVGMAEVSSCMIEALPGQHVWKGDELGYFQNGGSSMCLIFRPGVIDSFVVQPPFSKDDSPVKVNAHLATAR
ncbi:phosphatidylserine decarboxylase [Caballeronia grimmiae]|uniref:phosphatidylserine decarboxylase n=1 Tax=Caballeronia grimmiae TaxID=1071679 RepID=UPI0038BAEC58